MKYSEVVLNCTKGVPLFYFLSRRKRAYCDCWAQPVPHSGTPSPECNDQLKDIERPGLAGDVLSLCAVMKPGEVNLR